MRHHYDGIDGTNANEERTGVSDVTQGVPSLPFKPAGSWLVVQMEAARDKTSSGILYVPDTAKDAPQVGKVLAVGPGNYLVDQDTHVPLYTKVGDRILFQKYAGAEIEWTDGKTYLFVKDSDVVSYVMEAPSA